MQLSDTSELERQELALLVGLNATEPGKRLFDLFRRELARLDKQNRTIGQENKESAAQWIADLLEQVDSEKTTETPPDAVAPTPGE